MLRGGVEALAKVWKELYAPGYPGDLMKMQILIEEVWEGAQESAFLPSSQAMPV